MGQGSTSGNGSARLEDAYHIQKVKLGQGSFGTVWRAIHKRSNEVVAVKQLDKSKFAVRGVHEADVEREIKMMQHCAHENLLRLYETFADHRNIYMALEYCDGGDLSDKIKERGLSMQEQEAAEWMRQICSAVAALHSKAICHRDVKPDNYLVAGNTLKLSDFGLAVMAQPGKLLTEKGGTPAFMSPEQHHMQHSKGYWLPVDVWAMGVSMYMLMFGGQHPFMNDRGALLLGNLTRGVLDFSCSSAGGGTGGSGFFGFGAAPAPVAQRFSQEARSLCQQMVDPNPRQRIKASATLRNPWLTQVVRQHAESRRVAVPHTAKAACNTIDDVENDAIVTCAVENAANISDYGVGNSWILSGDKIYQGGLEELMPDNVDIVAENFTAPSEKGMDQVIADNNGAQIAEDNGAPQFSQIDDGSAYMLELERSNHNVETARLREVLAQKEAELAEHKARLSQSIIEVGQRDAQIAELKEQLLQRAAEHAQKQAELRARETEISELRSQMQVIQTKQSQKCCDVM